MAHTKLKDEDKKQLAGRLQERFLFLSSRPYLRASRWKLRCFRIAWTSEHSGRWRCSGLRSCARGLSPARGGWRWHVDPSPPGSRRSHPLRGHTRVARG